MSDKENIWKSFAITTDGRFVKREEAWLSDRTEIRYKCWSIFFDYYNITSGKFSHRMTRVIAPIIAVDDFRFELYRNGFVRKIEKIFGAQDVEIGRAEFDKAFVIKTNNEFRIKTLLQNQKIRSLIEAQKDVSIIISDQKGIWEGNLPKGELELAFYADGEIKDFEVFKSLLLLFKQLLDKLEEMDAVKNSNRSDIHNADDL